jgi:XTP/dITP diphosphohydrolase
MLIWFATGNEHKRGELAALLPQADLRLPAAEGLDFQPEETGVTFLENALIKAQALYKLVGEPVIADDSGLCVDALGGRPGVLSARYGSENGTVLSNVERNALLLKELGSTSNRGACFVCAMVLLLSADRFFAVQETLEGKLLSEPCGTGGFGYDPIFYLSEQDCTVAELPIDLKNKLSHRGKAARQLSRHLPYALVRSPLNKPSGQR